MQVINRDSVQELIQTGAKLIEVLPEKEYETAHIQGAINLPLAKLDANSAQEFSRSEPMIVYCNDYQWDLSPRAAWRLESLGFTKVFDYMAGKEDWAAYGLPMEKKDGASYVGDHLHHQVPICALRDSIATVRERLTQSKMDLCVVVNQHGIVLGACEADSLSADASKPVEEVMKNAPKTLRPSYPVEGAVKLLRKSGKTAILVTSPDGKLMGLFTNSG